MRRILTLAGLPPVLGRPGPDDPVGVWGRSPLAARGERIAAARGARLVRIEDAFLRSVRPGRAGDPPLGLLIDRTGGVHFDADAPSALETLLARHPLDDTALLDRARTGMARIAHLKLSKYNQHDPAAPPPEPGYVLVIDQTRGDASVRHGGPRGQDGAGMFRVMLGAALEEHPHARILIRSHPETAAGLRDGHYGPADAGGRVALLAAPLAPQAALEGAVAVYTLSSQMGFEAILAGHRPVVFGRPFYAGWGLTDDRAGPLARRGRRLTRAQLFAAAMILAPTWYDPCRDRLCSFEAALDQLEAETRAWREDGRGHVAAGARLWKRGPLQAFYGRHRRLRFAPTGAAAVRRAAAAGRDVLVWGTTPFPAPAPVQVRRIEDGFLRSAGLGARLVPPLSLVADARGIYFDPAGESDLEALIAAGPPPGGEARAARLVAALIAAGVTKYNLSGPAPALPGALTGRRRVLVPGQVENDASILRGAGAVRTNRALLEAVRAANPEAAILWKPHPDVEAGLRPGAVGDVAGLADATLGGVDALAALALADAVWTMTSTLGFEALLRGIPVTCLGAPFYAGWGLTTDLGPVPARRTARPTLAAFAHAALIAYPRYRDPVSGLPCPPEVAVERLAAGTAAQGPGLRLLAKAQGLAASIGIAWR
ncbi:MAG: capsular polysaccharide biosynthesis protein [Gemmobacter sp.]